MTFGAAIPIRDGDDVNITSFSMTNRNGAQYTRRSLTKSKYEVLFHMHLYVTLLR